MICAAMADLSGLPDVNWTLAEVIRMLGPLTGALKVVLPYRTGYRQPFGDDHGSAARCAILDHGLLPMPILDRSTTGWLNRAGLTPGTAIRVSLKYPSHAHTAR